MCQCQRELSTGWSKIFQQPLDTVSHRMTLQRHIRPPICLEAAHAISISSYMRALSFTLYFSL